MNVGRQGLSWTAMDRVTASLDARGDELAAAHLNLNGDGRPNRAAPYNVAASPRAIRQRRHFKRIVDGTVTVADHHGMCGRKPKALRQCRQIRHELQLAARKGRPEGKCPEGF